MTTTITADQTQTKLTTDVLVIGAGLSGLQAAQKLQAAGVSCHVLEATDRVGGKTRSVPSKKHGHGVIDVGAAWVNDTSQSEMYKLFHRYNIQGEVQLAEGKVIHELSEGMHVVLPYGVSPASPADQERLAMMFAQLGKLIEASDLKDPASGPDAEALDLMSFKAFCTQQGASSALERLASLVTQGLLGVEPDEISALYMINYFKSGTGFQNLLSDQKDGGQYLRARQGMDSVAKGLAAELKAETIHLRSPVAAIVQEADSCTVRTVDGTTYKSAKVIVSVPSPLLRHMEFSPALPKERQTYVDNAKLGSWSKMIYVFEKPFWRDAGLSGVVQSLVGPISMSRDTSVPKDDQWSITCFLVGEPGRKWSKLSADERRKQAWKQFVTLFENAVDEVPDPVNVIEQEWAKEAFFEGAPNTIVGVGVGTRSVEELCRPFGNVHFVGTETSDIWKGYMEGAVRSGQRGAAEVLQSLK